MEPQTENDTVIVSAVAELFDRTVAHVFFGLTAACLMRRWVPEGQASPSAQNACNMASQASPHLHSNKKRHTESIWECLLDLQHIVASKVCVCGRRFSGDIAGVPVTPVFRRGRKSSDR